MSYLNTFGPDNGFGKPSKNIEKIKILFNNLETARHKNFGHTEPDNAWSSCHCAIFVIIRFYSFFDTVLQISCMNKCNLKHVYEQPFSDLYDVSIAIFCCGAIDSRCL